MLLIWARIWILLTASLKLCAIDLCKNRLQWTWRHTLVKKPWPCQDTTGFKTKSWNFTRGSTSPTPLETAVLSTPPPPFQAACSKELVKIENRRWSGSYYLNTSEILPLRKTTFACEIISLYKKSNKNPLSAFSLNTINPRSPMDGVNVKDKKRMSHKKFPFKNASEFLSTKPNVYMATRKQTSTLLSVGQLGSLTHLSKSVHSDN